MIFLVTQVLNQSIRDVPLWEALPFNVFRQILAQKEQSMKPPKSTNPNDYESDPYSEAAWLKQFGGKLE